MIKGVLKDKTVVLVTHQLQYLSMCDRIIVLKNGKIAEQGTFDELMKNQDEFSKLMKKHIDVTQKMEESAPPERKKAPEKAAAKESGGFMMKEERTTGNVGLKMYFGNISFILNFSEFSETF